MTRFFVAARAVVLLSALAAGGCGGALHAVEYSDPRSDAAAKLFIVPPGRGNIYVYRDQVYLGDAPVDVVIDERWTGRLVGQTYVAVEVDTGLHLIRARGEKEATLDILVGPGQNSFVWLQVGPSLMSVRATLHPKAEAEGRAAVGPCRRVDMYE
jgi:hypothetical protein